jgi:hypothetical protein
MSKWYYKETERDIYHVLYTVMIDTGGTHPETDSDHNSREDAARRVAFLNGDRSSSITKEFKNDVINALNDFAIGCNVHEYGLPRHDESQMAKMRELIQEAFDVMLSKKGGSNE